MLFEELAQSRPRARTPREGYEQRDDLVLHGPPLEMTAAMDFEAAAGFVLPMPQIGCLFAGLPTALNHLAPDKPILMGTFVEAEFEGLTHLQRLTPDQCRGVNAISRLEVLFECVGIFRRIGIHNPLQPFSERVHV